MAQEPKHPDKKVYPGSSRFTSAEGFILTMPDGKKVELHDGRPPTPVKEKKNAGKP